MRRSTTWLLPRGFAALLLLALPACVEGTTTSGSAATPNEATGTTAPVATTPVAPATPAAPISPHPTTTAVAPVATAPSTMPTVAPTATAPTTIPGTTPAAGPVSLAGTWESATCNTRTFPRRITFTEGAATSFTAEDLVSPCPKGTTCVWSGIINRSGTYKVAKDLVTLTVSKTSNGPTKTEFPTTLTLDASRAPVEPGIDGGKPCPYTRSGGVRKP
ncbi:MAG: hypothetical protein ABJE95_38025 [Byssovorax sp.]